MTLERGLRRTLLVLSMILLASGVTSLSALAAAAAWSARLDRQMAARVAAEGCPPEIGMGRGFEYDGGIKTSPVVSRLSGPRWRIAIPKHGHTYFYVLRTSRELTDAQMVRIADDGKALPGVEVLDCLLTTMDFSRQNQASSANRLILWWIERPFMWVLLWPFVTFTSLEAAFVSAVIVSPLVIAVGLTALTWGLFYVVRWVARGFSGT